MKKKKMHTGTLGRLKSDVSAYWLILPSLLCLLLIVWRPIFTGMYLSLFKLQGYTPIGFAGLENYRNVLNETLFNTTLANTFKYVGYSLVVGFVPPIFFAIMINEIRYMKSFVKFSIYFPSICPAIITSLMWTLIYDPSAGGLLNNILIKLGMEPKLWLNDPKNVIFYIIVTMTWAGFGGAAILYLSSLQSISKELYEAAYIDGAGLWQRTWHITLPQISGIILLMLIKNISGVFQVFTEPMTMTGGGPNNASVSLALLGYRYAFVNFKIDKALAVGVVTFILLFIMTLFYFKVEKKVNNDA